MKLRLSIAMSIMMLLSISTSFAQVFPHTDPTNIDGWILNTDISDEFENGTVDETKWLIQGRNGEYQSNWIGRAPSQFVPENIRQESGMLKIETKWEPEFPFSDKIDNSGNSYENITTGAIIAKKTFLYGYMEILCKIPDASMTGAFWGTGSGFELDVFEHLGKPSLPNKEQLETEMWSSIHDWSMGGKSVWTQRDQLPFRVAGDFHTYSCEWDPEYLKFYADGELVRTVSKQDVITSAETKLPGSRGWVIDQPMYVWMDSETFPWHGIPVEADLPVDYEIKYIRVWQKDFTDGPKPVTGVEISNPELNISLGQTAKLEAAAQPLDAANLDVSWSSSNSSIVKVNGAGTVTPMSVGEATVTVKTDDGNFTTQTKIYVSALRDSNLLLDAGFETQTLDAWAESNGSTSAVANNTHSGQGAAYLAGSGTINQRVQLMPNTTYTLSGWGKVTVDGKFFIIGAAEFGFKNKSARFTADAYAEKSCHFTTGPEGTEARIFIWTGDADCRAYADDMKLVGGTANQSVSSFPVTGVELSSASTSLSEGESKQLTITVIPSYATNKVVTWASTDTSIVTVSADEIIGVNEGEAKVIVTTFDGGFKDTINVIVLADPKADYITYEAEDFTDKNASCQFKTQWEGYTGTGYMNYASESAWMEWDDVEGSADSCNLIFTYSAFKGEREFKLYINDTPLPNVLLPQTATWKDYKSVKVKTLLNSGKNTVKLEGVIAGGGPLFDKMDVEFLSSLEDTETSISTVKKNLAQVYPNPSEGVFTLELEAAADICINDMTGKVIYRSRANAGKNTIDISQHHSGILIVSIKTESNNQIIKLLMN